MMQYIRKFADSIALALAPLHRIPHWQTSNPSKETTLSFAKMPQYVFTFLASSEAPHLLNQTPELRPDVVGLT